MSTFRNAGPGAATARSTLTLRSCQCVAAACATYGMWWATAIAVMSLRCWALPQLSAPGGAGGGARGERRRAGALHAGVHVRLVVVADEQEAVAALERAGQRLQPDVVGAAVAGEDDDGDLLVGRQRVSPPERALRALDAARDRGGVLEGDVQPGHVPGGRRVPGRRDLEAAGRVDDDHRALDRAEHGSDDERDAASLAERVAAAKRRDSVPGCGRVSSDATFGTSQSDVGRGSRRRRRRECRSGAGRGRRARRPSRSARRRCRRAQRRPRRAAAARRRGSRRGRARRRRRRPGARPLTAAAGKGRNETILRRPTGSPASRRSSTTSLIVPAVEPSATIAVDAPSSRYSSTAPSRRPVSSSNSTASSSSTSERALDRSRLLAAKLVVVVGHRERPLRRRLARRRARSGGCGTRRRSRDTSASGSSSTGSAECVIVKPSWQTSTGSSTSGCSASRGAMHGQVVRLLRVLGEELDDAGVANQHRVGVVAVDVDRAGEARGCRAPSRSGRASRRRCRRPRPSGRGPARTSPSSCARPRARRRSRRSSRSARTRR